MQKKIKTRYVKTNMIGFSITVLFTLSICVYANITFPSNEVLYSNTESGLSSNNVQGAIDELYKTCTTLTPAEQIIENAKLTRDPYECRYFFKGGNPNNYITFNNETWRIISVECDGSIKIIKRTKEFDGQWDLYYGGSNLWTNADLNKELNVDYLNTLNQNEQNKIVLHDWNIGGLPNFNLRDDYTLKQLVDYEKKTTWNGKIALITVTEYLRTNSDENNCNTVELLNHYYNKETCKNTNWLYYEDILSWWTLTANLGYDDIVYTIDYDNAIGNSNINTGVVNNYVGLPIFPVVYLSSDIKITSGNGSSSSPYTIE